MALNIEHYITVDISNGPTTQLNNPVEGAPPLFHDEIVIHHPHVSRGYPALAQVVARLLY
jgi:hypothetical protein